MSELLLLLLPFSEAGFSYVAQASLVPPGCNLSWSHIHSVSASVSECWDFRHPPPYLAYDFLSLNFLPKN